MIQAHIFAINLVTFLALKLTAIYNSYLIKKYSFSGFRPKENTLAITPEPAVEPEIIKATPETVPELRVAEDTAAKTSQRTLRYFCETCLKSFNMNSHLKRHERIHTGEKPYSCKICKKRFAQKNNMKSHERIHTKKSYSCKICKKSFRQKRNLEDHHSRIHFHKSVRVLLRPLNI